MIVRYINVHLIIIIIIINSNVGQLQGEQRGVVAGVVLGCSDMMMVSCLTRQCASHGRRLVLDKDDNG